MGFKQYDECLCRWKIILRFFLPFGKKMQLRSLRRKSAPSGVGGTNDGGK